MKRVLGTLVTWTQALHDAVAAPVLFGECIFLSSRLQRQQIPHCVPLKDFKQRKIEMLTSRPTDLTIKMRRTPTVFTALVRSHLIHEPQAGQWHSYHGRVKKRERRRRREIESSSATGWIVRRQSNSFLQRQQEQAPETDWGMTGTISEV